MQLAAHIYHMHKRSNTLPGPHASLRVGAVEARRALYRDIVLTPAEFRNATGTVLPSLATTMH